MSEKKKPEQMQTTPESVGVTPVSTNAACVFFTDSDYRGMSAYDHFDIINLKDDPGYSAFDNKVSSIITLHGVASAWGYRDGVDYPCTENQGLYPTLGDMNDSINKIALGGEQNRPTSSPYLILRNAAGYNNATDVRKITSDSGSFSAITALEMIAIGSSTGYWYLYSGENYTGDVMVLSVTGGTGDYSHGFYQKGEGFTVRSARQNDPERSKYEVSVTTGNDTGDDTKNDIYMKVQTPSGTTNEFEMKINHNSKGDLATFTSDMNASGDPLATIIRLDGNDAWSCTHQWVTDLHTGRTGYAPSSLWLDNSGTKTTNLSFYEARKDVVGDASNYKFTLNIDGASGMTVGTDGTWFKLFDEHGNATPFLESSY
ncbi:TPA: hypothetical protein JG914_004737, partial [Enterobacter hormaechei subsp. steigerwaltii]|nr:hypothetical protein [Enterobacter hormaechei subsp. steigerwaltii]